MRPAARDGGAHPFLIVKGKTPLIDRLPDAPRIVAVWSLASGESLESITPATNAAINGGDLLIFVAAGDANMAPQGPADYLSVNSGDSSGERWRDLQPQGQAGQTRLQTYAGYATCDIPVGAPLGRPGVPLGVKFPGPAGGKAAILLAVSGAQQYGVLPAAEDVAADVGAGVAMGWSCGGVPANLLMVNATVISGGGGDNYAEDEGWTFLGQTPPEPGPAIRIAYKYAGEGGAFSYALTGSVARDWYSGAVLVK